MNNKVAIIVLFLSPSLHALIVKNKYHEPIVVGARYEGLWSKTTPHTLQPEKFFTLDSKFTGRYVDSPIKNDYSLGRFVFKNRAEETVIIDMKEYTPSQISKTDDPLVITVNPDFTVTASEIGENEPAPAPPAPPAPMPDTKRKETSASVEQTAGAGSNVPATTSSGSTVSSSESTLSNAESTSSN